MAGHRIHVNHLPKGTGIEAVKCSVVISPLLRTRIAVGLWLVRLACCVIGIDYHEREGDA